MQNKGNRVCSIDGCEKKIKGYGFCESHYRKYKRWGDPLYEKPKSSCKVDGCARKHKGHGFCEFHLSRHKLGIPFDKRKRANNGELMEFIKKTVVNPPPDRCVNWPFSKTKGYGLVNYKGKQTNANRVALALYTGENPPDKHACHGPCHNPGCINPHPEHGAYWGSAKENNADKKRDGTHGQGSQAPFSKLTESDVLEAIALREKGWPIRSIADHFKVHKETIGHALRGTTWSWLTGINKGECL